MSKRDSETIQGQFSDIDKPHNFWQIRPISRINLFLCICTFHILCFHLCFKKKKRTSKFGKESCFGGKECFCRHNTETAQTTRCYFWGVSGATILCSQSQNECVCCPLRARFGPRFFFFSFWPECVIRQCLFDCPNDTSWPVSLDLNITQHGFVLCELQYSLPKQRVQSGGFCVEVTVVGFKTGGQYWSITRTWRI